MTTLIDAVQTQEPGSELVELIEVEIASGSIYLHSGIESDLSTVQFRDLTTPATIRTYTAIPVELTGIERNADGASSRPTLVVANVLSTFRGLIGDLTNKDLIGKRVIRRQTLKKYLYGESADANPPIEFPVEKFIIDRVASENKVAIKFELASVMDLEGVKLPNRIVVGKYCNWEYQGIANGRGGCTWKANSKITVGTTEYKAYFTIDDEPILPDATVFTAWVSSASEDDLISYSGNKWRANATTSTAPASNNVDWTRIRTYTTYDATKADYTYDSDDYEYVESGDTIWRLVKTGGAGNTPTTASLYWVRGDVCGKILNSCKARYQWQPKASTAVPTFNKDTSKPLPFGGFPGSEKYR